MHLSWSLAVQAMTTMTERAAATMGNQSVLITIAARTFIDPPHKSTVSHLLK